jgi:rare lipoprotein A
MTPRSARIARRPLQRVDAAGRIPGDGGLTMPARCGLALALAATLMLGACASGPSLKTPGAGAEGGQGSARRGAYYLDDGPGNGPMPDLDAIPDATPRREPLHPRANRPYVVFERSYTPMTALAPYRERGVGSWYGRRYHGQKTSSGEVYDMYAMTAAHPTLPIPSYVRVTRPETGRSVVVRINDRGPFLHGRLIDLSYVAAAKLGYAAAGSAEVEVELLTSFEAPASGLASAGTAPAGTAPAGAAPAGAAPAGAAPARAVAGVRTVSEPDSGRRPPTAAAADRPERLEIERLTTSAPAPAPPVSVRPAITGAPVSPTPASAGRGAHFLQLAAFASQETAESSRARLARELDWLADRLQVRQEGGLFKIQAGPYRGRDEAVSEADRIRQSSDLRPFPLAR